MTQREALEWLCAVDGRLYRSPRPANKDDSWVAIVRTPRSGLERGKLIVGLGESMVEATEAASSQWNQIFTALEVH